MLSSSKEISSHIFLLIFIIFFTPPISGYHIINKRYDYDLSASGETQSFSENSKKFNKTKIGRISGKTEIKRILAPVVPVSECSTLTAREKNLGNFENCATSGSFPIENECRIYLHCVKPGIPSITRCCPLGLHFDHRSKSCLEISVAECTSTSNSDYFGDQQLVKRSTEDTKEEEESNGTDDFDDFDYKSDKDYYDDSDEEDVDVDRDRDPDQVNFYPVPSNIFHWNNIPHSKHVIPTKYVAIPVVISFGNLPPAPKTAQKSMVNQHEDKSTVKIVDQHGQYQRHIPEGQYQGQIPEGQYQGHTPEGQYHGHIPEGQYQGHIPEAQYQGHIPESQYQSHSPGSQYQGHIPESQYQGHIPEGQYQGHIPESQYQGHVPVDQYQSHVPNGQSQDPIIPGSQYQGLIPEGQSQDPIVPVSQYQGLIPEGQSQDHIIPASQYPVLIPESQSQDPIAPVSKYQGLIPEGQPQDHILPVGQYQSHSPEGQSQDDILLGLQPLNHNAPTDQPSPKLSDEDHVVQTGSSSRKIAAVKVRVQPVDAADEETAIKSLTRNIENGTSPGFHKLDDF